MNSKTLVPPIKCQGIKTKLVPLVQSQTVGQYTGRWIEPFMGSGVVGLNMRHKVAVFSDINPHLIHFYQSLKSGSVTGRLARLFLEVEGKRLAQKGEEHYYFIRDRFNQDAAPLDFLFLSRACFNGMIRFNGKGKFNVPFCRKPERFSRAYITKIVNQIDNFTDVLRVSDWEFLHQDFDTTISMAGKGDLIYCDPPYLGRYADYYSSWSEAEEARLHRALRNTEARFVLSTWLGNKYRDNPSIENLWSPYPMITQEHFYHVGAKESNRNAMTEALILNFPVTIQPVKRIAKSEKEQLSLWDEAPTRP